MKPGMGVITVYASFLRNMLGDVAGRCWTSEALERCVYPICAVGWGGRWALQEGYLVVVELC